MRDPNRIEGVLEEVKKIWKEHPELRLGQLLSNVRSISESDIYYIEDDVLVKRLRHIYKNG